MKWIRLTTNKWTSRVIQSVRKTRAPKDASKCRLLPDLSSKIEQIKLVVVPITA